MPVADQPEPTLAEIAGWHRHYACPTRTSNGWHEAAARQIDALAGLLEDNDHKRYCAEEDAKFYERELRQQADDFRRQLRGSAEAHISLVRESRRLREALASIAAPGWTVERVRVAGYETLVAIAAASIAIAQEALAEPPAEQPRDRLTTYGPDTARGFDELFASGVDLHIERMDEDHLSIVAERAGQRVLTADVHVERRTVTVHVADWAGERRAKVSIVGK